MHQSIDERINDGHNHTIHILQGQVEQSSIPSNVCMCQSHKSVIALYPNMERPLQIKFLLRQHVPNEKGFHEFGKTFYFQASKRVLQH